MIWRADRQLDRLWQVAVRDRLVIIPYVVALMLRPLVRLAILFRIRGLVRVAGIALIVVGFLCLCLSGVVLSGWWQGTLEAFGVGFVVGGLVDVLAISGLNRFAGPEDPRPEGSWQQELNRKAESILQPQAEAARDLLYQNDRWIDPQLRNQLWEVVYGQWPSLRPESPSQPPPAWMLGSMRPPGTPDHSHAFQAPETPEPADGGTP